MASNKTSDIPGERIAKVMARAGLASRRQAEAWIAEGRVTVNGAVISSPALNVTAADRIVVNGTPLPMAAVSYTHLDVYKRQILPRALIGKSSIQYVNDEDKAKPKTQSYKIYADAPVAFDTRK